MLPVGSHTPGAAYQPEDYVPRSKLEAAVLRRLDNGRPVLLWSRRGQGRTWLHARVVRRCSPVFAHS